MLWPPAWSSSLTNPHWPEVAPSPSGKVITTHKKHTQTPFWFQSVSTSLPSSILEKEIILLAEQLVSIAAFSKCTGRAVRVREKSVICPKRWKEGNTRESRSWEPRGGLDMFGFIPTSRAEYSLLHSKSLNCVVISTLPFVLLYLFITALVWTINLICLPKERQSCVTVWEMRACLHLIWEMLRACKPTPEED